MEYLKIIPRTLWKIFFLLNFLVGLIILYPFFKLFTTRKEWYPACFKLMRFWAWWIATIPGVFVKKEELFPIKDIPTPCVYCANHQSYLDIVMSYHVFPEYFIFLGKAELKKAPLFSVFFEKMNILVDRKNRVGAAKAYKIAADRLEKGESLFLFPEGTISSNGKMIPFKAGAAKFALDKQVPIIPVTYVNNFKLLQNGGLFKSHGRPGIARVVIHPPIYTKGMGQEDLLSLNQQLFDIINEPLQHEHR